MSNDMFRARERAEEAVYFGKLDARLIEAIREKARLSEIAAVLADKLRVDNQPLLRRIAALGVSREVGAAFLLAPLVQVAWADGKVNHTEHALVLDLAARRGVTPGSADHAQLLKWLAVRPTDELFDAAIDTIRYGLAVLPEQEARERVTATIEACKEVARASSILGSVLHMKWGLAGTKSVLDSIAARLSAPAGKS